MNTTPTGPSGRDVAIGVCIAVLLAAVVATVWLAFRWEPTPPGPDLAQQVKTSMQHTLDTDPNYAKYDLTVTDVQLVKATGNEYDGIATVRTRRLLEHNVAIEVTADDENVMWSSLPGQFAFLIGEKVEATS